MANINAISTQVSRYLESFLDGKIEFIQATQLKKSSREAPWKLDILFNDSPKSFVLQLDPKSMEHEFRILEAMSQIPVPTPKPYGLDVEGTWLGFPAFFSDFIDGESLLQSMLNGNQWAEELYLDSVLSLHQITPAELGDAAGRLKYESAIQILEEAYEFLKPLKISIVEKVYDQLISTSPEFPELCFSNGDLWLDNFIVKNRYLSGVIDFANACFSDPIYEFLLSFFAEPGLQNRGIEERFCRMIGFDPGILHWYHGLEFFDTLRWVIKTKEPFEHHTENSLITSLEKWVEKA